MAHGIAASGVAGLRGVQMGRAGRAQAAGPALPLPETPTLSEVFPETSVDGAAPAFVLAAMAACAARDGTKGPGTGPILWVQDRLSQKETGRPYLAGMSAPPDMLLLSVSRAADVLWAMEQGLGCPALCGVVGEIWGAAPALDFTATKRLALRAEAHGVPAWLIRRAGPPDLSAARLRWRIASAPSERLDDDPRAPGLPRWTVELFRARTLRPGIWTVRYDPARDSMEFAAPPQVATERDTNAPSAGKADAAADIIPLPVSA